MKQLLNQLQRFLLVGALNTGIGLSIIWLCMWMGLDPLTANLIGYTIGGVNSYMLNRNWTFAPPKSATGTSQATRHTIAVPRFLLALGVSYLANVIALTFTLEHIQISPYLAQCVAAGAYSGCFFVLSRLYVFKEPVQP